MGYHSIPTRCDRKSRPRRVWVKLEEIPQHARYALIADERAVLHNLSFEQLASEGDEAKEPRQPCP
jgi:hypothetical protein